MERLPDGGSKSATRVSAFDARPVPKDSAQILRAGLKVFSEKGVQGATMEDIGARARSGPRGSSHYHLQTRNEILSAELSRARSSRALQDRVRSATRCPARRRFRPTIRRRPRDSRRHRDFIRFIHVRRCCPQGSRSRFQRSRQSDDAEGRSRRRDVQSRRDVRSDTDSMHWATEESSGSCVYFIENRFRQSHQLGTDISHTFTGTASSRSIAV